MSKLLTPKQQAFVREYLVDFNATQAARRAGYEGTDASLAVIGSQNIRKYHIHEAIQNYLGENSMGFEEVIYRLTRQARGTLGDLLTIDEDGTWIFDLQKAIDTGAIDLVEKLIFHGSRKPDGSYTKSLHVKLHSAQKALIHLGKAYGLWQGKLRQYRLRHDGDAVYSPPLLGETGE
jgi:phage terminase small subunit